MFDQVATKADEQHMEVALESVKCTKPSNLEHQQNKEYTPNRRRESMLQEQELPITKGTKEANAQGKHQENPSTTQQHIQVSQHTNVKVSTGALTEKQQDKREKAIWKVKEISNTNGTTNISNKENEGK
ncbi:hypothetical protein RDI58_013395 [Solanum bulbocastanum]|uniref:Uncharacterized protein n=1 Tax=Solanum bulbocastanum TaxID=147425 RepID=A0AAN8YE26_SOLBU